MRVFRSAGIAAFWDIMHARFSADAVKCFFSPVLRCWFRVHASCAVSCKALPGHNVDIDILHIYHAEFIVSRVKVAGGSSLRSPMPDHRRRCLCFGCDHPPNGGYMTQPLQSAAVIVCILGKPARDRTSACDTLSCQDMPMIRRMLLGWNVLRAFSRSCLA